MRSVVRRTSYGSAKVAWLDRDQLELNIRAAIGSLAAERPEVRKVILFGSAARTASTPASDVDLALIVDDARERFIDRPIPYQPYFSGVGLGVDLVVYTREEARSGDISLLRVAERTGRVMLERD
jgi:predicted nucleotidyltransferase